LEASCLKFGGLERYGFSGCIALQARPETGPKERMYVKEKTELEKVPSVVLSRGIVTLDIR
jgi:hypothetical protein